MGTRGFPDRIFQFFGVGQNEDTGLFRMVFLIFWGGKNGDTRFSGPYFAVESGPEGGARLPGFS